MIILKRGNNIYSQYKFLWQIIDKVSGHTFEIKLNNDFSQ